MDTPNVIDTWLFGIEHREKLKDIVKQIHITHNTILRVATYQNREHLMHFGKLSLYHTIIYEWEGIHYVKITCSWGTNTNFIKYKYV